MMGFLIQLSREKNSTIVDLPADLSSDAIQEQPLIKKRKSAMSDLFGEVFITKVETAKSFEIRLEQELTGYKSEDNISLDPGLVEKELNNPSFALKPGKALPVCTSNFSCQ